MKGRYPKPNSQRRHAARMVARDIVANPDGNREERRAAKKLGVPPKPASAYPRHAEETGTDG